MLLLERRTSQRSRLGDSALEAERNLVRGVLAGNRTQATILYRQLLPVVDRTLRRILGRREADHDDLIQQSFEQIVSTFRERRFSHACPLSVWARTLASRVALAELRRRYRQRRHVDDATEAPEAGLTAVDDWHHQTALCDQVEVVRRELGRIDPGHAWVIVLHDLEGQRLTEIAQLLGVSLTAAQSRLLRGRKELLRRCQALQGAPAPDSEEEIAG